MDTDELLCVDIWDQRQVKRRFIETLTSSPNKFKDIFIFTQNEMEYDLVFDEFVYPLLGHYVENSSINVDLITSLVDEKPNVKKYKGLNIHFWPTYWLYKTYGSLQPLYDDRLNLRQQTDGLKYHFIMMNNRCHRFRCELIDKIAEQDLLKFSAYTWNNRDAFLMDDYIFKWFDGKTKTFNDNFTTTGGQYHVPIEYFQSFAQLISESTPHKLFFSEKISTALIVGKPFIAAAGQRIHAYLRDVLGFKLYDEIFDYSFDDEPDMNKRWDMITDNFKRLSTYTLKELESLQLKIQDKIAFNQLRVLEIMQDINFMPPPIQKSFQLYKEGTYLNHGLSLAFSQIGKLVQIG